MKTKLIVLILLGVILFTSCADKKTIDGKTYRPYGLFNESSCRNDSIHYEVSGFAVFSGLVFMEMLFIPTIYTFGYNIMEPICKKSDLKNTVLKGVE